MIDLIKKISKIKKESQLKKFKIDKPIFIGNYLFHYLILTNNLEGMKLIKHPIYKENDEGLQGFHLAAKTSSETKNYEMLELLLKEYPEYSGNRNFFNETFLDYLVIDNKLINLIKKFKKINWFRLISIETEVGGTYQSYLSRIFLLGSYKLILFIIKKFDFCWSDFKIIPFFNVLFNNNLSTKNKISILEKLKDYLNLVNINGKGIIYYAIEFGELELIKFLIENDIEVDKYLPIYTLHPFIYSYEHDIQKNNDFKVSKYIWDKIKETHNFNSTNRFGENLAFTILKNRNFSASFDNYLEKDILTRNNNWNKVNIDKETIINEIILLPFEKYHHYLKNTKIDTVVKNKNNLSIIDLASGKWLEFLKKFKSEDFSKNNVKLENYKFSDTNSFASGILDAGIFFSHLDKKYKNLYIPKCIDKLNQLDWELRFNLPNSIITNLAPFSWVIFYEDKYNYFINPNLNFLINSIKNDDNYDCAALLLSVKNPFGGLHAELIYYDFKNNQVERFDPYGNSYDLDPDIDLILEEELTWNTGFNYLNVKNYMPVSGFQTLSDELNEFSEKPGDFGGYCFGWCLWYLEHKLLNLKFTAKELFPKLLNKILRNKNSLIEYIRNYSNSINKERLKILKKIGIKENKLTNSIFTYKEEKKILNYLYKKFCD
tara:strand:- start:4755 stop:6731 length:1977 start_codon:yes stop_codon:yes gene_type:complete